MSSNQCDEKIDGGSNENPVSGKSSIGGAPMAETSSSALAVAPFDEVNAKIKDWRRFISFDGRARRGEFWVTALYALLPALIFSFLGTVIAMSCGLFVFAITLLLCAVLGASMLPVTVRRWHDFGMTGWAAIAVAVGSSIPYVGFLVSIAALVFYCLPGTPKQNDFGPNPLDASAPADGQYKREPALPFWIAYGAFQLIYIIIALVAMNNTIKKAERAMRSLDDFGRSLKQFERMVDEVDYGW